MAQSNGRPRVLLADSDGEALTRTARRLGRAGYDVVVAYDGEEALARATAERPDLCVLDAVMPKLSGYDVARALRASARTRAIPVLLLTVLHDEAGAFDPGADAYLPKPCSPHELDACLEALLAGRRDDGRPVACERQAQKAPRRISTAGMVFSRITRSSATDQRSR
jgi:DNA-binding response OmpR family regulator